MAVDIDDWDWISKMAEDADMSPLRLFCCLYPTHGKPPKPYKARSSQPKTPAVSTTINRIPRCRRLKKDVDAEKTTSLPGEGALSEKKSSDQEQTLSDPPNDTSKEETAEKPKPQMGGKPLISSWAGSHRNIEYPDLRILFSEGPLHLRSMILDVLHEMVYEQDYPTYSVGLLAETLMSEGESLSEKMALPWTAADDDWRESEQHAKWRDFTDEKILSVWKEGEKEYPAHNCLLRACDALGISLSAWKFAWNIVAVDDPGSNMLSRECFDEVFDAYEKKFVKDRIVIQEIREYLRKQLPMTN